MKFVLLRFGVMNELACQLINLSTCQLVNYPYHKVQCSNLKVQR